MHNMISGRFRGVRRTAMLLAVILGGAVTAAQHAHAQPAPPEPPSETSAPPAEGAVPEIVESWTLTPGGSADGDEAGSRPNLSYQIAPGETVEDSVIVYNLGNVPLDLRVYATDAFNNDDGEFDLLPGEEQPVDAGSWVTLAQSSIVLEPGTQATIPITIAVPADATPGDHVGAIVASNVAISDNEDGQVVKVDRRTGTRLYVQVAGPLRRELAVLDMATTYHPGVSPFGGSTDLSFRVENQGNVRLGGIPEIQISGPFGLGKKTRTLEPLAEILPGQEVTLTASFDDVPALLVQSTTVRITPVDADSGEPTAVGKDRTLALPVVPLLVLLIALLAITVRRAYLRHRDVSPPLAPVASGADLEPHPQ